jgi:DNA-binding response OmpR family regulator
VSARGRSGAEPGKEGGPRVLVVDDRPDICELLRGCLADEGYDVTCDSDGEDALRRLQHDGERFDLAVVDATLPGAVDGLMLAGELDRLGTRVLIITGDLTVADELVNERFPLLRKPFRISQLLRAVRALSAGSKAADTLPP